MLADSQLPVRIIAHHIEVTRAGKYRGVTLTTGYLLNKNIETTSLGHLEGFDILVPLFDFLMIQPKLPI